MFALNIIQFIQLIPDPENKGALHAGRIFFGPRM